MIDSDHRVTPESDEVLVRSYADGDVRAREEIARRYMPLAERLAAKYRNTSEPLQDLRQVAYLGLLKTIDRYDPARGPFMAYAISTIRGELRRHFRDHGWTLHVTRPVQERYLKVTAAIDAQTTARGRVPTPAELAETTGLALNEVVEALDAAHCYSPRSLDEPIGNGGAEGSIALGDGLGEPDTGFAAVEFRQTMKPAFAELPERQQQILKLRFVDDLTQSEIAERCGVSQMHVSRLLRRSLDELAQTFTREP